MELPVAAGYHDQDVNHCHVSLCDAADSPKVQGAVTAYTWEGNPVNISCEVDAHPSASVVWFRDGLELLGANSTNVKIYNTPTISYLEVCCTCHINTDTWRHWHSSQRDVTFKYSFSLACQNTQITPGCVSVMWLIKKKSTRSNLASLLVWSDLLISKQSLMEALLSSPPKRLLMKRNISIFCNLVSTSYLTVMNETGKRISPVACHK